MARCGRSLCDNTGRHAPGIVIGADEAIAGALDDGALAVALGSALEITDASAPASAAVGMSCVGCGVLVRAEVDECAGVTPESGCAGSTVLEICASIAM